MGECLEKVHVAADDKDELAGLITADAPHAFTQLSVLLVQWQLRRAFLLDSEADELAELVKLTILNFQ